jgi:hypothetical protein
MASMVADEITALMPGAGPPPTNTANLPEDISSPDCYLPNVVVWNSRKRFSAFVPPGQFRKIIFLEFHRNRLSLTWGRPGYSWLYPLPAFLLA